MLQFYRLVRQYWPYVGPFVALFALSKWLGVTVVQVEMALTSVSSYVWQAEIRWLVAAILCLYFSYTQIRNRGVPLTIVSTEVELTLLTAKGDRATLTRIQKIRANHENVTGYWRRISGTGSIDREHIECTIEHGDSWLEFESIVSGTLLMHRFKQPLPKKILPFSTTERRETIPVNDSFTGEEEFLSHEVPFHYRHRQLTVTVYFHSERQCSVQHCKAVRITNAGVTDLRVEHVPPKGGLSAGVQFRVRRVREGDRYKITWKYPKVYQSN